MDEYVRADACIDPNGEDLPPDRLQEVRDKVVKSVYYRRIIEGAAIVSERSRSFETLKLWKWQMLVNEYHRSDQMDPLMTQRTKTDLPREITLEGRLAIRPRPDSHASYR